MGARARLGGSEGWLRLEEEVRAELWHPENVALSACGSGYQELVQSEPAGLPQDPV